MKAPNIYFTCPHEGLWWCESNNTEPNGEGRLNVLRLTVRWEVRSKLMWVRVTSSSHTLEFAKEKYFNGHSDTRSVQENFDLLTSFIQESVDKHIPSKTSRSVSSNPWITHEIRRKIRRKNKTRAKAKKTGSSKFKSKFETLRREIN